MLADLKTDVRARLSKETHSTGRVALRKGTTTLGSVSIRGPVIIGERCRLGPNVHIGPYTSIGDECTLRNVEVENSIIMKGCKIESGERIIDSLIGSYSTIANGTNSVPQGHRLIIGERSFAQI